MSVGFDPAGGVEPDVAARMVRRNVSGCAVAWPKLRFAALAAAALFTFATTDVHAQPSMTGMTQSPIGGGAAADPDKKMLVTANELVYDYENNTVSAVGAVQLYYDGASLEAGKVTFDRNKNAVIAEGNVRLKEKSGQVVHADRLQLTQDFKQGFIESLRVDSPDKTHFAATRADRTEGNITVFQNGVYTACEPCKDKPEKPVLWQVKAARIIHNQQEQMIYY
ncbi:MAG: organic solvent tolerance protein, partial [Rhizobiales bacterium 32-66-8]